MTPGEARVQAVIDALDDLAAWSPENMADVFRTLAALPGLYGAAGETGTVVALTAEETRTVTPEATAEALETGAWVTAAAGRLGETYSRWPLLRGSGTRWLPRARSAP